MPHVTFIHGIANKPPKEKLLENWEAELAAGGLEQSEQGAQDGEDDSSHAGTVRQLWQKSQSSQ